MIRFSFADGAASWQPPRRAVSAPCAAKIAPKRIPDRGTAVGGWRCFLGSAIAMCFLSNMAAADAADPKPRERIEGTAHLSTFRSPEFGTAWGVAIKDGPMRGLMSRAVVVLDGDNKVLYAEQVPEISQEPNYAAALAKLG